MATRQVLATVGTTKFDLFISTLCSPEILRILQKKGYNKLLLQIGNGNFLPEEGIVEGIDIKSFRLKDSIASDIQESSLVISHAGAGSCLEVLDARKPLIVVINEQLMNNHQLELAQQLHFDGHAYYCTCSELKETLENRDLTNLKPFCKGNSENFVNYLDTIFGFKS